MNNRPTSTLAFFAAATALLLFPSAAGGAKEAPADNRGHRVILQNILVGEVWLASGQSNMQSKVAKSNCNKLQVEAKGIDGLVPGCRSSLTAPS